MNSQKLPPKWLYALIKSLAWTRTSYYLFSGFIFIIALIIVVWWPLVVDYFAQIDPRYPWWWQMDWLLVGIFLFMSLAIMARADLRRDGWLILIGLAGGLVIEGWGTQTQLWSYFTGERPPLWIIPAWPIANLTIDRIMRVFDFVIRPRLDKLWRWLYYAIFLLFFCLLIPFSRPAWGASLTQLAILSCLILFFTPGDYRKNVLMFLAGAALGAFLEYWGTTRRCWMYYTRETPPFFAILAHGLAAVAFWRVGDILQTILLKVLAPLKRASNQANS